MNRVFQQCLEHDNVQLTFTKITTATLNK